MGSVSTITATTFPKQGDYKEKECLVMFHLDSSKLIKGVIVRDDIEEPYRVIIKLDDGRYVLSTECLYTVV